MMRDEEFIVFLCEQLWDVVSDGNDPDLETIKKELRRRDINPDDVFVY